MRINIARIGMSLFWSLMSLSKGWLGITYILFLFFLVIPVDSLCQKYHLSYYTTANGLPTNEIKHATQDQYGFIWMATDAGLINFDGYQFTSYANEIPSRYGRFLTNTSKGILYSHDAGISLIKPAPDTVSIENFLQSVNVPTGSGLYYPNRIFQQRDSTLWISQPNGRIARFSDGTIVQFDLGTAAATGNSDSRIFLCEMDNGNIWAVSQTGIIYFFDAVKNTFLKKETIGRVNDLIVSKQTLWLGGEELYRITLDEEGKEIQSMASFYVDDRQITCLAKHSDGNIFLGIHNKGLFYLEWEADKIPRPKAIYSSNDPHRVDELPFKNIYQIYVINEEEIWICSAEGFGVLKKRFFETADDLPHGNTTSITQAENGLIFISFGDLFSVKPDRFGFQATAIPPVKRGTITSLTTSEGLVWAGTSTGELFEMSESGKIRNAFDFSWRGEYIFYLFNDSKNRKWICQAPTEKPIIGVGCLLPDNRFKEYGIKHGLNNRILVVKESPNKRIYAAGIGIETYLYRYLPEEDAFLNLSLPFDFPVSQNFEVHDFTIDIKGLIWMATTDGLLQYNMDRIRRIDLGRNYQDIEIRAITSLPDGSIWLSTDTEGILRFQGGQLLAIGEEGGLPAKIMSYRALMADRNNRLWAGTVEGAVYSIQSLPKPGKTNMPMLISVTLEGKRLPLKQLQMAAKQVMHIRFSTPSYYGFHLFYQYRLDEEDWQEPTKQRELTVSNLEAGTHSLHIRAKREGGYSWSESLVVSVEVLPPWYRRSGIRVSFLILLIFLIILSVIWAVKRYRMKLRLLHEEIEFKRESAYRHETDIVRIQEDLKQVRAESRANIVTLDLLIRIISVIHPGMKWSLVMENLAVFLLRPPGVIAFEIGRKIGENLEIEGYSELTRSFISFRVPFDPEDSLACYCVAENKTVQIADIAADYNKLIRARDHRIEVYRSAIGVPLYLEHSRKAALFIFSDSVDYFDKSSLKALEVVAAYIEQIV